MNLFRALRLAVLPFLLMQLQSASADGKKPQATLHFKIVDPRGNDLGVAEVTVLQRLYPEPGPNQGRTVRKNVARGLAYGTYHLRLYVKGFRTAEIGRASCRE